MASTTAAIDDKKKKEVYLILKEIVFVSFHIGESNINNSFGYISPDPAFAQTLTTFGLAGVVGYNVVWG